MLAQNFKTAADLGITDKEFNALAKVLGMFERNEIKADRFSMRALHCGTTACIKGWCQIVSMDIHMFQNCWDRESSSWRPNPINELFGYQGTAAREKRTPSQAATALRNYLTHGEPRWAEAMSA